jgi:hypothetical protein
MTYDAYQMLAFKAQGRKRDRRKSDPLASAPFICFLEEVGHEFSRIPV